MDGHIQSITQHKESGRSRGAPRAEEDTLSVTLQNGVIRLVGVLHGNGLRKFSQHPLLEVLEPLVVITTTDKLLVLQKEDSGTPVNWYTVLRPTSLIVFFTCNYLIQRV